MKLKDYFEENCINISMFCRKYGINYQIVYSLMNGRQPSLKTAMDIEKATKGAVTAQEINNNSLHATGKAHNTKKKKNKKENSKKQIRVEPIDPVYDVP